MAIQISKNRLHTTCTQHGPTVPATAALMTSQLQLVNDWVLDSKMKLNLEKSSVMWFRVSSQRNIVYPNILVNDLALKLVDKQKYLGVAFDSKLSWTHQVSNVCKNGILFVP